MFTNHGQWLYVQVLPSFVEILRESQLTSVKRSLPCLQFIYWSLLLIEQGTSQQVSKLKVNPTVWMKRSLLLIERGTSQQVSELKVNPKVWTKRFMPCLQFIYWSLRLEARRCHCLAKHGTNAIPSCIGFISSTGLFLLSRAQVSRLVNSKSTQRCAWNAPCPASSSSTGLSSL